MNRWTIPAALTLGASIAASCMVYGPEDLEGAGSGGTTGMGGSDPGRGGGGMGMQGGGGSAGSSGGSTAGASGSPSGGSGNVSGGGRAGEVFGGEGGDVGGAGAPGGGGSGATSGTGGTGGTAGSGVVDNLLIDNMEDGDHRIEFVVDPQGVPRNGFWYTYAVGTAVELLPTGMFVMEEHPAELPGPGEGPNSNAFRLYARQVQEGAGNGAAGAFNFRQSKEVYDASRYLGISFWVRASKNLTFRLQLATKGTDASGEVCMPDKCSDHFFVQRSATTAWKKIEARWDGPEFTQEGWGTPVTFSAAELMSVLFFVPAAATHPEVELWIDDVAFIAPPS